MTSTYQIPELLDLLIVGGGPAGTAAAFRAHELGIKAMLIDFDDILKRIRDYPKDKQILPDFGGGDMMSFPAGGTCVGALQFEPIDKDDMHQRWKEFYKTFGVPVVTGLELTGATRSGDVWNVATWHHRKREAGTIRARHVVLAIGRGVPRRLDLAGNTEGLMYRMDDPAKYVTDPVLVIGGGTSAAEAVLAISEAKIEASDPCPVYWSFRGTKMPAVSKALAERFFEAFVGNGNIRSLPDSEPVGIVTGPDKVERISLKIDRRTPDGRPPETSHLEFGKHRCIACIGEDIPEKLLLSLGISMVQVGDASATNSRKMMAVTSLFETQQPNIYLIGDLLSQSYLEVDDFKAPAEAHRKVKHRGNIKTSLRDGVFVAEVIKQRLEGRAKVEVQIKDAGAAESAPAPRGSGRIAVNIGGEQDAVSPADQLPAPPARLVLVTPTGIEAGEFPLQAQGSTSIGRVGCDISFEQDTSLSDAHASISMRGGAFVLRDDGSRSGTYLRIRPDHPVRVGPGELIRAGRQFLMIGAWEGGYPVVEHFAINGEQVGTYTIRGTVVFGRSGGKTNPDVVLDEADQILSRFHMSIAADESGIAVSDFNSVNGTFLKVDEPRRLEHGDIIRIGAQLLQVRLREDLPEKTGSSPVAAAAVTPSPTEAPPAPAPPKPAPGAAAPSGPHCTFQKQKKSGPLDPTKSILKWCHANDVEIDWECEAGMCGADVIRIISGSEHLNPVTEKEIKALKRLKLEPGPCRLACMSKASGPIVVDVEA